MCQKKFDFFKYFVVVLLLPRKQNFFSLPSIDQLDFKWQWLIVDDICDKRAEGVCLEVHI